MQCERYLVQISHAKDDVEKVTLGLSLAMAAAAKGMETVVALSNEGARLAVKGYCDDLHEKGFPPVAELLSDYADVGGKIWV